MRVMRNFAGIGLFAVALLGAAQARGDVTLGPGEILTASVSLQPKMKNEQWTTVGGHEAKSGPGGGVQMTLL